MVGLVDFIGVSRVIEGGTIRVARRIELAFEYEVVFTSGAFDSANTALRSVFESILVPDVDAPQRAVFAVERRLLEYLPDLPSRIDDYFAANLDDVLDSYSVEIMDGGEEFKTLDVLDELLETFYKCQLDRHAVVAIIGGGAFLDVVGLAASLVHRGLRQLRLPTTVLAQCDSGVGVKTGVNLFGKKNYVGTFAPPAAVLNDFDFLDTLENRDWISGIPEAFKVAMIKDADFFQWLLDAAPRLAERDRPAMEELVRRCAIIHLDHIANSGDPFETGSARPLDFGHWLAHKLEMDSNGEIRHGEAVAIGLLVDSLYAVEKGLLDEKCVNDMKIAFQTLGLPLDNNALKPDEELIAAALEDFREHLGGELHVTLPNGLGNKIEHTSMDISLLRDIIARLKTVTP